MNQVGTRATSEDGLRQRYLSVFNDRVGKLRDFKVHLYIDRSVPASQQPCRRIPFHLAKAVEDEIDKLVAIGVWEPVKRPTEWVSPLVVAQKPKKPGQVRITVDSRAANKAIERSSNGTGSICRGMMTRARLNRLTAAVVRRWKGQRRPMWWSARASRRGQWRLERTSRRRLRA